MSGSVSYSCCPEYLIISVDNRRIKLIYFGCFSRCFAFPYFLMSAPSHTYILCIMSRPEAGFSSCRIIANGTLHLHFNDFFFNSVYTNQFSINLQEVSCIMRTFMYSYVRWFSFHDWWRNGVCNNTFDFLSYWFQSSVFIVRMANLRPDTPTGRGGAYCARLQINLSFSHQNMLQ
jgi:hypothetical protein